MQREVGRNRSTAGPRAASNPPHPLLSPPRNHRISTMRLRLAAAACIAFSAAAAAAPMHEYGGLAMSPAGDRVAAIENAIEANSMGRPHGHIIVRSAATGAVIETIDPCAHCGYSGLVFASDGRLAFLMREGRTTRLLLAGKGAPSTLASFEGIAAQPRFSPDGREIALLVTIGARKEAGATQAGVPQ